MSHSRYECVLPSELEMLWRRYRNHLGCKAETFYRPEFRTAAYERFDKIRESRPFGIVSGDDLPLETEAAWWENAYGGSYECPEHGSVAFNSACSCGWPLALDKLVVLGASAAGATRLWIGHWERAHGSRWLPFEQAFDVVMKLVWRSRNLGRAEHPKPLRGR